MSDTDSNKEVAIVQPSEAVQLPPQQSATDTTNWDTKVSTDPSGEKYIRTIDEVEGLFLYFFQFFGLKYFLYR